MSSDPKPKMPRKRKQEVRQANAITINDDNEDGNKQQEEQPSKVAKVTKDAAPESAAASVNTVRVVEKPGHDDDDDDDDDDVNSETLLFEQKMGECNFDPPDDFNVNAVDDLMEEPRPLSLDMYIRSPGFMEVIASRYFQGASRDTVKTVFLELFDREAYVAVLEFVAAWFLLDRNSPDWESFRYALSKMREQEVAFSAAGATGNDELYMSVRYVRKFVETWVSEDRRMFVASFNWDVFYGDVYAWTIKHMRIEAMKYQRIHRDLVDWAADARDYYTFSANENAILDLMDQQVVADPEYLEAKKKYRIEEV